MALNSRLQQSRDRFSIEDLRSELLGQKSHRKVDSRVSKGVRDPFDMQHFVTVITMTMVATILVSVVVALLIGLTGFTLQKVAIACIVLIPALVVFSAVADNITPESDSVRKERIRRQKKAMGSLRTLR